MTYRIAILVVLLYVCAASTAVLAHSLPIVSLKDIDQRGYLAQIKTHNDRSTRYVYRNGDQFVKIWGADYISTAKFLKALEVGFYDTDNTPLAALIYDAGICRGYITHAGVHLSEIVDNTGILYSIAQQKDKRYIDFYQNLLARSRKTGLVYVDLIARNLALHDGKIKMIDLEWVVTPDKLPKKFFNNLSYPKDYRNFVKTLQKNHKSVHETDNDEYTLVKHTSLYLYYVNL